MRNLSTAKTVAKHAKLKPFLEPAPSNSLKTCFVPWHKKIILNNVINFCSLHKDIHFSTIFYKG